VDDGMTQNSATLPATPSECPRGECHNPDGICDAEMFCQVDPCNGHECAFGEICQTNMCGGCHPVCAPDPYYVQPVIPTTPASKAGKSTTTEVPAPETTEAPQTTETPGLDCPEAKWHISTQQGGANTCTNDDQYPSLWETNGFLLNSARECCDKFFSSGCTVVDNCPDAVATTVPPTTSEAPGTTTHSTDAPGADCPEMKWHVSTLTGGAGTCTNDNVYPPVWDTLQGYLFDSAKECCESFGGDCEVVDHCDCPKNWHMSVTPGESETCTNDLNYPNSWRTEPHLFIFQSSEECCQQSYDNPDCNLRDVCKQCIDTWHVNPEAPGTSW
jgi:hypothetical protein